MKLRIILSSLTTLLISWLRAKKKRRIGQEICIHFRLSHGGYDNLEQIMIKEKRIQRELKLEDPSRSLDRSTSPTSHHENGREHVKDHEDSSHQRLHTKVAKRIVKKYFFQYYLFYLIQFSKDEILFVL